MLAIMGFLILQDKNRISGQHGGSSNQPQQAALEIPISLEFLPLPARLMISTLLFKQRGKAVQCSVWHSAACLHSYRYMLPSSLFLCGFKGSSFKGFCSSRCLVGPPVVAWSSAILFAQGPGSHKNILVLLTLPVQRWSSPFLKSRCVSSLFTCSCMFRDKLTLNWALWMMCPNAFMTEDSYAPSVYIKQEQDGTCSTPVC